MLNPAARTFMNHIFHNIPVQSAPKNASPSKRKTAEGPHGPQGSHIVLTQRNHARGTSRCGCHGRATKKQRALA
jgi:hypothetical protein